MTPGVRSPSRGELHLPVAGPSRAQPEPGSDKNELSLEKLAVTNKQGHISHERERENREEVLSRGASTDVDQNQSPMPAHDETNFPLVRSEDLLNQEQLRGPEHDRSDSESYISFDPELSSLSNEDHNLDEVTAHDIVVQKLYDELVQGFHGCTEEEHYENRRRHLVEIRDGRSRMAAVCD